MKNKKPVVVICFSDPKNHGPKINDPKYFRSYKDLCAKLEKNNISAYIAKGNSHCFLGSMVYKSVAKFINNKLVDLHQPIQADLALIRHGGLWLKGKKPKHVLNQFGLIEICRNKFKTYQLLKMYMPKTYLINTANFHSIIKKIATSKVVIKPIYGACGTDVFITAKTKISPKIMRLISKKKCIAQEFIDTKKGITDIVQGYHDLRIINFSGKLCLSYVRQPGKNLVSNLDRQGEEKIIPIEKIPDIAIKLCEKIDKKLEKFGPRIYSIDMGFENGKPIIIELNGTPGMPFYEYNLHNNYYDRFHSQMLVTIKQALDEKFANQSAQPALRLSAKNL